MDVTNTDTANFTDNTVTFTDISLVGSGSITFTFMDAAFIGETLTQISDSFPSLTASLVGNTITLSFPIFTTPGTYTASYSVSSAASPEPQAIVLSGGLSDFSCSRCAC